MNAKDARELAFKDNKRLNDFYSWVISESKHNRTSGNYYPGEDDLTDAEIEYLRSQDYRIYWNGACLWYEVNWG